MGCASVGARWPATRRCVASAIGGIACADNTNAANGTARRDVSMRASSQYRQLCRSWYPGERMGPAFAGVTGSFA